MKHLIISVKSSSEVMGDFKRAFSKAKRRGFKTPHYEISFDNRRDFEKFVRHLPILSVILKFKPKSVYELAKISGMDVSNLNKVILFFEEVGAIQVKTIKVSGRTVRKPIVEYNTVEFNLAA